MVLMAPSDEAELMHMVATAAAIDDRPSALRYPRGEGTGACAAASAARCCAIGRGRVLREGSEGRDPVARAAAGGCAARPPTSWPRAGCRTTVADARFAKPLDTALIEQLARHHEVLITIEEMSSGGFGAAVMHHLAWPACWTAA